MYLKTRSLNQQAAGFFMGIFAKNYQRNHWLRRICWCWQGKHGKIIA